MTILPIVRFEDRVVLRGAPLPLDTVVLSMAVDLSTRETGQVTIQLLDKSLALLASGRITRGATVDVDELRLVVAAVEVEPGPAGHGALTMVCRSVAVRQLRDRRGDLRVANVSPSQFVTAECAAAGVAVVAQDSPVQPEVVRDSEDPDDSSWSTFARLAGELGYIVYEASGTVYFGQPTWLLEAAAGSALRVGWLTDEQAERPLALPRVRTSEDAEDDITVSLTLPHDRAAGLRPGGGITLYGLPGFERNYLVESVGYDLTGGDVSVTAVVPRNPDPRPPAPAGAEPGAAAGGGSGSWADVGPSAQARSEIPPAYLTLYQKAAGGDDNFPWAVLAGLGWVESRHGANMGPSGAGARGPMQFLPSTWAEEGVDGNGDGRRDIMDPADAIPAAASFLRKLHDRTKAPKTALAAYNAGPGNIRAGLGYADKVLAKAISYMEHGGTLFEDGSIRPTVLASAAGPTPGGGPAGRGTAAAMVEFALAQAGDTYVFGAEASLDDANPDTFDCSELVEWATARAGGSIPDGSSNQIAHCARGGGEISVDEGIRTRGALLWRSGHIAISLGNGRTIEARGRRYGVLQVDAAGRFTRAGRIPGLTY